MRNNHKCRSTYTEETSDKTSKAEFVGGGGSAICFSQTPYNHHLYVCLSTLPERGSSLASGLPPGTFWPKSKVFSQMPGRNLSAKCHVGSGAAMPSAWNLRLSTRDLRVCCKSYDRADFIWFIGTSSFKHVVAARYDFCLRGFGQLGAKAVNTCCKVCWLRRVHVLVWRLNLSSNCRVFLVSFVLHVLKRHVYR